MLKMSAGKSSQLGKRGFDSLHFLTWASRFVSNLASQMKLAKLPLKHYFGKRRISLHLCSDNASADTPFGLADTVQIKIQQQVSKRTCLSLWVWVTKSNDRWLGKTPQSASSVSCLLISFLSNFCLRQWFLTLCYVRLFWSQRLFHSVIWLIWFRQCKR